MWSQTIFCLIVVSLIAGSTAALAHQGDRIFPIYEITDDMLLAFDVQDGTIFGMGGTVRTFFDDARLLFLHRGLGDLQAGGNLI